MTTARHSLPSFLTQVQTETDTTLFSLTKSAKNSKHDVNPVDETGLTNWDTIFSDCSGEETQVLKPDGAIETPAERDLQAAPSENRRRETDETGLKESARMSR